MMKMINGHYRIYLEDKLIIDQSNALTTAGRSIAIKSLLGIIPNFAGSIAYGIGNKANIIDNNTKLISNSSLQFEIGRSAVISSTLDISNQNDLLVYTTTINDPFQYKIHEVGLYPSDIRNSSIGIGGSTIFDFDRVDVFNKIGSASGAFLVDAVEARMGTQVFYVPPTDSTDNYILYSTTENTLSYLNRYVSQDTFRLAGIDLNTTTSSVYFRFYTDSTNYYEYVFPTPTSSGYFITEIEKGSVTIQGTPTWDTIAFARIWRNNSNPLYLDALRIDSGDYLVNTTNGLISRAVLAEPVRKPPGIPMTIEYTLALDFNYGIS